MVPPFACDPIDCSLCVLLCKYNTLILLKAASFLQDKYCNIPLSKQAAKLTSFPGLPYLQYLIARSMRGSITASKKKSGDGEGLGTRISPMCLQSQATPRFHLVFLLIDLCIECII